MTDYMQFNWSNSADFKYPAGYFSDWVDNLHGC